MKNSITVVVSAYNEESTLGRCLSSVGFADEIIVVDNTSQDKTLEIAKKFTKNVYTRPNILMLNENKNFGFGKASGDWILNLDADEVIPKELAIEIQKVVKNTSPINGYWMKRKNITFGKWIQHGLWWPDKQIRLFRRAKGTFPCKHIHEYIQIEGQIGELDEVYTHYNYESVHQYLTKIDRASTSESLVLRDMDYQIAWYDAIRFPVSDFLKIYFAQKGYKDGLHGLVLALFQAFYSFCVFAKTWEYKKFPQRDISPAAIQKEIIRNKNELSYWTKSMVIENTTNPFGKIYQKLIRKTYQNHA